MCKNISACMVVSVPSEFSLNHKRNKRSSFILSRTRAELQRLLRPVECLLLAIRASVLRASCYRAELTHSSRAGIPLAFNLTADGVKEKVG
ncbi:hypothetical protein Q5P01_001310 [Channa striata]|uniref:Uncharacterized protein n=1 Tax=Channa striata TaxID=64152 RepID=A0AA88NMK8_CHASR|nr:hypothetical protein Q5P01_001310 [Channa striata]